MVTISKNNDLLTVIITFSVKVKEQQDLINRISNYVEAVVKKQPGFISASLHRSLDGKCVVNYAQWRSRKDFDNFFNNLDYQSLGAENFKLKPEINFYEVAFIGTSQ
jgi:heme-degrading monooxygenase HmoA